MLEFKPLLPHLIEVIPPEVSDHCDVIAAYLNVDFTNVYPKSYSNNLITILKLWLDSNDYIIRPAKWSTIIQMFETCKWIKSTKVANNIRRFLANDSIKQCYFTHQQT